VPEVAQAFVRVRANTTGFRKDVAAGIGPNLKHAVFGFAGITAGLLGMEAAVHTLRESVQEAGQVQKSVETINQVFGESGKRIEEWATTTAASLGVTDIAALEAASRVGILAKNLKIGQEKAATMTLGFEQLVAAISSIRGSDPNLTFKKLPLVLAGNIRSLKELGFTFSSLEIKQQAVKDGLIKMTGTVTPAVKAQAIYSLITKNLGYYQGLAAKHSGDLINKQRQLSAEWALAQQRLGKELLPAVTKAVTYFSDKLPNAVNKTAIAYNRLKAVVVPITDVLGGLGNVIKVLIGYKLAGILIGWGTKLAALGTTATATAAVVVEAQAIEDVAIQSTIAWVIDLETALVSVGPAAAKGAAGVTGAMAVETAAIGRTAGAASILRGSLMGLSKIAAILIPVTMVVTAITKGPKQYFKDIAGDLNPFSDSSVKGNLLKDLFGTDLGAQALGDTVTKQLDKLWDAAGLPNKARDRALKAAAEKQRKVDVRPRPTQPGILGPMAPSFLTQISGGMFGLTSIGTPASDVAKITKPLQKYQQLQLDALAALRTKSLADDLKVARAVADIFNRRVKTTKLVGKALYDLKTQQQQALNTVAQLEEQITADAQSAAAERTRKAEDAAAKRKDAADKLKAAQEKHLADVKASIDLQQARLDTKIQSAIFTTPKDTSDEGRLYRANIAFVDIQIRNIMKLKKRTTDQNTALETLRQQRLDLRQKIRDLKKDTSDGGGFSLQDLWGEAVRQFNEFGSNVSGSPTTPGGAIGAVAGGILAQKPGLSKVDADKLSAAGITNGLLGEILLAIQGDGRTSSNGSGKTAYDPMPRGAGVGHRTAAQARRQAKVRGK